MADGGWRMAEKEAKPIRNFMITLKKAWTAFLLLFSSNSFMFVRSQWSALECIFLFPSSKLFNIESARYNTLLSIVRNLLSTSFAYSVFMVHCGIEYRQCFNIDRYASIRLIAHLLDIMILPNFILVSFMYNFCTQSTRVKKIRLGQKRLFFYCFRLFPTVFPLLT